MFKFELLIGVFTGLYHSGLSVRNVCVIGYAIAHRADAIESRISSTESVSLSFVCFSERAHSYDMAKLQGYRTMSNDKWNHLRKNWLMGNKPVHDSLLRPVWSQSDHQKYLAFRRNGKKMQRANPRPLILCSCLYSVIVVGMSFVWVSFNRTSPESAVGRASHAGSCRNKTKIWVFRPPLVCVHWTHIDVALIYRVTQKVSPGGARGFWPINTVCGIDVEGRIPWYLNIQNWMINGWWIEKFWKTNKLTILNKVNIGVE